MLLLMVWPRAPRDRRGWRPPPASHRDILRFAAVDAVAKRGAGDRSGPVPGAGDVDGNRRRNPRLESARPTLGKRDEESIPNRVPEPLEREEVLATGGPDLVRGEDEAELTGVAQLDRVRETVAPVVGPVLGGPRGDVEIVCRLGAVALEVRAEDRVDHLHREGLETRAVGALRHVVDVSVAVQHQLRVAVDVDVGGDVRMTDDPVAQGPGLGLAEGFGAVVDVAVGAAARARSAPVRVPVPVEVHAERAVTVVETVLAPESELVPRVLVAVRVQHRDEVPLEFVQGRRPPRRRRSSRGVR